jgi:hypothetical protein
MTRISKQQERRSLSPRKHKKPQPKTGPLKDKLPLGYKPLVNALEGSSLQTQIFIGKVK